MVLAGETGFGSLHTGTLRKNRTVEIAISGAGVAGAALAHWLHRTGHTPTLIEQAPSFRTGGYRRAFDAYQALLRPFIKAKQASAVRYIPFFATRTRFGLWFRSLALRMANFGPLATLFAGSVRDDFRLPDYDI